MDKQTLKNRAYREFRDFLIIALYLWVIFGLFILYKSMILNQQKFSYLAHGLALFNALALGKIMLIAQAFHLGDQADEAPLIYPTLLKSALFSALLTAFKILEAFAVGQYRGRSFQESIAELAGGTWQGIVTLSLLLFVTLIPFFAFGELERVMGEGTLARLFFRPRDPRQSTQA